MSKGMRLNMMAYFEGEVLTPMALLAQHFAAEADAEKRRYGQEWLEQIAWIKRTLEAEPGLALRLTFDLGQSYGLAAGHFRLGPLAVQGYKFEQGRKKPRLDVMARAMLATLKTFPDPKRATAKELWERMHNSPQNREDLENMDFHSFQNRLTRLRKKYLPAK